MVTHEHVLCTGARQDITYHPLETNCRYNCTNRLTLDMAALGFCVLSQPRAPASHHRAATLPHICTPPLPAMLLHRLLL